MSFIIKGIDIPKTCRQYPCCADNGLVGMQRDYFCAALDCATSIDELDQKLTDCPLVEIPTPHGRLIDADALRKTIESIYGGALWTFDCFECIRKAPTVIEAEVSE